MMGEDKIKNEDVLKRKLDRAKSISFFTFIWIFIYVNGALLEISQPGIMKIVLFDILPRFIADYLLPAFLLTLVPFCLLIVYIASRIRIHQINDILGGNDATSSYGLVEAEERLKDAVTVVDDDDETFLLKWNGGKIS